MADLSVSVVVPVRNGENFLGEALESALSQTLPPDEVVVVDDGSTDGTADVARAFPVRLMPNDGRGVSAARNTGISASRGDVIAFLDHDDLWEQRKLERQVARLQDRPLLAYVTCRIRVFVEPGAARPEWLADEALSEQGYGFTSPSSLAVRRETFDEIGAFNPELAMGEDLDWVLRARDAGMSSEVVDEPLVRYRLHGENTTVVTPVTAPVYLRVLRSSIARRRAAGDSTHAV